MRRPRSEDGFALVAAMMLLTTILTLGLALLLFADQQQKASARQQFSESAFTLAEAALNAELGQLSRQWPATKEAEEANPRTCTPTTSTAANGCPAVESLNVAYPNTGTSCPAGTQGDAWGSSITNKWTTYVRDDVGESAYFSSTAEKTAASWDQNGDGKVWVRSVGVVNCRVVTLVEVAAEQLVPVNFPQDAFAANWFTDTNNGNKVIIDRKGKSTQPGGANVRCREPHPAECAQYRKGQISPEYEAEPPGPSITLSAAQLEALKDQAKSEGRFYSGSLKNCPASIEGLSGKPTYVEGCGALSFTGNGTANSEAKPGFLVLGDGTIDISGNTTFYGVIYAVNSQNSSEAIVSVHGNGHVVGAIVVDGSGGIEFGSSKENLVFDSTAIGEFKLYAGAAATRNSFRVLPTGQ